MIKFKIKELFLSLGVIIACNQVDNKELIQMQSPQIQQNMDKKIIKTNDAPAPIGPYNQAVLIGNTLYVSGQIALDPSTGKLMLEDIQSETRLVMKNLEAILVEANMNFNNVVKSSIFISDMNNFAKINEVYGEYFDVENAPARETVQVARLPKDVNVEISVIAIK